jgi:hypothetical protein
MDAAQSQPAAAVAGTHSVTGRARQTSGLLNPAVISLVADQLSPKERALLLRPLCKEARDLLLAPVVQLSQPVPAAAFAAKWGQPDSVEPLGYWHRHEVMCLTAKSGVLANLRLLSCGPWRAARGRRCRLRPECTGPCSRSGGGPTAHVPATEGAWLPLDRSNGQCSGARRPHGRCAVAEAGRLHRTRENPRRSRRGRARTAV